MKNRDLQIQVLKIVLVASVIINIMLILQVYSNL